MAYIGHLRGILTNTDQLQMVQPMLGEFQSHCVHLLCFLQASKPSIFTRVFLVGIQAVALPLYFTIGLVYPQLCCSVARISSAFMVRFYTGALTESDDREMPHIKAMEAQPVAMWFYKLPMGSPFDRVLKCMRADEYFNTIFNELCNKATFSPPMAKHLVTAQRKVDQSVGWAEKRKERKTAQSRNEMWLTLDISWTESKDAAIVYIDNQKGQNKQSRAHFPR